MSEVTSVSSNSVLAVRVMGWVSLFGASVIKKKDWIVESWGVRGNFSGNADQSLHRKLGDFNMMLVWVLIPVIIVMILLCAAWSWGVMRDDSKSRKLRE